MTLFIYFPAVSDVNVILSKKAVFARRGLYIYIKDSQHRRNYCFDIDYLMINVLFDLDNDGRTFVYEDLLA